MVALIWLGLLALAFVAWWAGRHKLAHPAPDTVLQPGHRAAFALLAVVGMVAWGFLNPTVGSVLVVCGVGAWLWSAWRSSGLVGLRKRLTRSPRPFVPLLLLVGLPRLLAGGSEFAAGATLALPSGIGQQLFYLVGLFAPLEAISRRPAAAAVASALLFALVHVPVLLDDNGADLLAATANAVVFQSGVGLVACLAYRRHRAAVPIGVAHALAIG